MTLTNDRTPRDVGDFFNPFFRVSFIGYAQENKEGIVNEEVIASSLNEDFTQSVSVGIVGDPEENIFEIDSRNLPFYAAHLSVDIKCGAPAQFTLTLTPTYDEAIRIVDNRLIQWGTLVKVQWGYASAIGSDILSKVHLFVCLKPQLAMNSDSVTVTFVGTDVIAAGMIRNQTRTQWPRSEYKTDLAIVEAMVKRHNRTLDLSLLSPDSLIRQEKFQSAEQFTDDWQFLRNLCFDNLVGMHFEGSVVRLYEMRAVHQQQQVPYRLLWRTRPTTRRDIPLMTFVGNADPRAFMPPAAISVTDIAVDSDTNRAQARQVRATQDASNPHLGEDPSSPSAGGHAGNTGQAIRDPQTGETVTTRPAMRPEDTGTVLPRPHGVNNADNFALRLAREAEYWGNTRASATAPGFPDLAPMMIVRVEGAGLTFGGPYLVLGVRHELGLDGYTMSIDLVRNIDPTAQGERPINPASAPPDGDGGTVEPTSPE